MDQPDWQFLLNEISTEGDFFAYWSYVNAKLWIGLSIVILIFSGLTSIIAALGIGNQGGWKAVLVALPAISTLLTAIIVQFHLREGWEVHELGRIETKDLMGQTELAKKTNPENVDKWKEIHAKLYDLKRKHATSYFSYLTNKTDGPPRNGTPSNGANTPQQNGKPSKDKKNAGEDERQKESKVKASRQPGQQSNQDENKPKAEGSPQDTSAPAAPSSVTPESAGSPTPESR